MMRWVVLGIAGLALLGCSTPQDRPARGVVIADAVASSVQVFTDREGARRAGSAVVLANDAETGRSLVLTSAHLLAPTVRQEIHLLLAPEGEPIPARLLAIDEEIDIALLATDPLPRRPVRLKDVGGLGEGVWVVAYPWGRERTVVQGVVSQIHGAPPQVASGGPLEAHLDIDGPVRLIDASVSYGMSGGGVFDAESGGLLGLVRGYRTAQMALPGGGEERLVFPVAGETTVVPTPLIVCFLRTHGYARLASLSASASQPAGCG